MAAKQKQIIKKAAPQTSFTGFDILTTLRGDLRTKASADIVLKWQSEIKDHPLVFPRFGLLTIPGPAYLRPARITNELYVAIVETMLDYIGGEFLNWYSPSCGRFTPFNAEKPVRSPSRIAGRESFYPKLGAVLIAALMDYLTEDRLNLIIKRGVECFASHVTENPAVGLDILLSTEILPDSNMSDLTDKWLEEFADELKADSRYTEYALMVYNHQKNAYLKAEKEFADEHKKSKSAKGRTPANKPAEIPTEADVRKWAKHYGLRFV